MADRSLIDVLLPSRGRPILLSRAIGSLTSRAADPSRVRMRVGVDSDDPETARVVDLMGVDFEPFIQQGYERLHVYYQQLAAGSQADWLLVWNDDAIMTTQGWDDVLADLPRRVLVADLLSNHSPTCCFPAVRQAAVQAIGGRFCSDNPHVDSFWEQVGRLSETIATVPIEVLHDQQPHPHRGNEHGFHDPVHLAEVSICAQMCRDALP